MADAPDAIQTILTLLSSNWNSANTDNVTPTFMKITDQKRVDFITNTKDIILAQRDRPQNKPAGIGTASKHVIHNITLDIRVPGPGREQHFLNVVQEAERILDSKMALLTSNYTVIEPDGDDQDLSNKAYGQFRYLKEIRLIKYSKTR